MGRSKLYSSSPWLIVLASLAVLLAVLFVQPPRADAIAGATTNFFPEVDTNGTNNIDGLVQIIYRWEQSSNGNYNYNTKMKGQKTVAAVYVPSSLRNQTINITIIGGCDTDGVTGRDNNGWNGNTTYHVLVYGGTVTADGNCQADGSTVNYSFTATEPPSSRWVYEANEIYYVYDFVAEAIGSENLPRYLNAFQLQTTTSGVFLGVSSRPVTCNIAAYPISCPSASLAPPSGLPGNTSYAYSSFIGDDNPSSMTVNLNVGCSGGRGQIFVYDLDGEDPTLGQNLAMSIRRNGAAIASFNHAQILALGGVNNQAVHLPSATGFYTFDAGALYQLTITGLSSNNALQVLPYFDPDGPSGTCDGVSNQLPSGAITASCTAAGRLTIGVSATDPDGGAVRAVSVASTGPGVEPPVIASLGTHVRFPPRNGVTYTVSGSVQDAQTADRVNLTSATYNCPVPPPSIRCTIQIINNRNPGQPIQPGDQVRYEVRVFNDGAGSTANQTTHPVSFSAPGTPPFNNQPVNYGTLVGVGQAGPFSFLTNLPPTQTIGPLTASCRAPNNPVIGGCPPGTVCDTEPVVTAAYVKTFGNDVLTGAGFGQPSCSVSGLGNVRGRYMNNTSNQLAGAGAQLAIRAIGEIRGFQPSSVANNGSPSPLAFANVGVATTPTGVNALFGGAFAGTSCTQDYWAERTGSTNTVTTTVPVSDGKFFRNGSVNLGPPASPFNSNTALFVQGNVFITSNITYGSTSWANPEAIPSFELIVCGDIFINSAVTRLDGFYAAVPDCGSGNIYTCSQAMGGPTAINNSNASFFAGSCTRQLRVFGAFAARRVHLFRSASFDPGQRATGGFAGTVNQAIAGETTANTKAGEVFIFTPEMYLARWATHRNPSGLPMTSILSLPPSF